MPPSKWNQLFKSCWGNRPPLYLANESNCLMATVSRKVITESRSYGPSPPVRFRENHWLCMIRCCTFPSIELIGKEKYIGKIETGTVYEQPILVRNEAGEAHNFTRIHVKLKGETRDGDSELFIITNLSKSIANAKTVARLYRDRWTIETAFQRLAEYLNSEINTLSYPRAALFGFCVALVAYMSMSVVKAALGSVHGVDFIDQNVSSYYVANEIEGVYQGMMIVIDVEQWVVFRDMPTGDLVQLLKKLSGNVKLSKYQKHPRGPKKPQPKRISMKNKPHVSTARILAERKKS